MLMMSTMADVVYLSCLDSADLGDFASGSVQLGIEF